MNRKAALYRISALFGGVIVGAPSFLAGCSPQRQNTFIPFNSDQLKLLDELGETIIPKTQDSEGASAANVSAFMNTIVRDFYSEEEQNIFLNGLKMLEKENFVSLTPYQRTEFVLNLEKEASQSDTPTAYIMMKQLTVWGYLTSEEGLTGLFDFSPVPGQYIPSLPYTPGDKFMNPRPTDWMSRNFANFHSNRKA